MCSVYTDARPFMRQFHQVVRAMTPLFTIILATVFLRKRSPRATWLSLIPVVAGVVFAT
jgi:drug/metabolite transporter (DMT)-like permease